METLMKLNANLSAIVTGGASGLGAATARRLAGHGVKVALFDLNAELGEALAKEIGGVFCQVDVTSEEQVNAGFAKARAALGQERILVNCAGTGNAIKTASRDKTTGEIRTFPTANFDRIIQINLVGTFRCIAKSAAGMMTLDMLEGERGAIVNTASVAAEDGQIGQASYTASKAGIVGMTLPIARDLMGGHPSQHHLAGHLQHPPVASRPRQRERSLGRIRAVSKTLGPARRIRPFGRVAVDQPVHEWRVHPH